MGNVPTNGIVLYRDEHIMAVLTGLTRPSNNLKTGDMLQVWILCQENDPVTSRRNGADKYICGDCPLSGHGCYVTIFQAPQNIWRKYKAQPVEDVPEKLRTAVRIGAYGDVAFLPPALVATLTSKQKHTSYTHQWLTGPDMSSHSMASIDTLTANRLGITSAKLKQSAQAKGYRTYRMLGKGEALEKDEIYCPNFTHGTQCRDCMLCNGNAKGNLANIATPAKGTRAYPALA
jgi:hypothetical protein